MLSIMQGIFKAGFTIAQNLAIDNAATAHFTLHVSILQRAQINNCMLKYEMLSMLLCPLLCPSLFIPLLFSLPLQPTLFSLGSSLKIRFLDDLTLGGDFDTVTGDVLTVAGLGPSMGLQLNPGKWEVFLPDATVALPPLLSDYTRVEPDMLSLLGAPLFTGGALSIATHFNGL